MLRSLWIDEFTKLDPNHSGGKTLFCHRLGRYMQDHGMYRVTDDRTEKVDFSLNVIQIHNPNARKKILRLDGVWHDTGKDYKTKNVGMIRALRACDAVVYQSQFAKQMADTFLEPTKIPHAVICNGAVPSYYDSFSRPIVGCPVFVAISKWRPHKRLTDIVESFLLANVPNAVLIVAGDLDKSGVPGEKLRQYQKNSSIHFLGNVSQGVLASHLCSATASIHLCWFDACPNSVVEALCAGVPVITNNVGGTQEIVRLATTDAKLICDIDQPYDFQAVDLYHPPKIDRNKVAEAIRHCHEHRPPVNREAVSIGQSALQYQTFMETLL